MVYMILIMKAFSAGLDFFTQLITADQFIADVFFTLCFISILISMFVVPFLGMPSGAGSDKVSSKTSNRAKQSGESSYQIGAFERGHSKES